MKAGEVPGSVSFNERTQVTIVLAMTELLKAQGLTELQCCALLLGMSVSSAQLAGVDLESFATMISEAWHLAESVPSEYQQRMSALARDVAERKV